MESGYKIQHILTILEVHAKVEHDNEYQTYQERNSWFEKQRGQLFSMIRGQCMQVKLINMKNDANWETHKRIINYTNPTKTNKKLNHTKDQYLYVAVYNKEYALHGLQQHNLTIEQCYEQFNTKFDVG